MRKVSEELETQRGQFLAALGNKPALDDPVPETLRANAKVPVLFIPWEKQTEIVPPRGQQGVHLQSEATTALWKTQPPGLYLSTDMALTTDDDYFRLGVVYSVQCKPEAASGKPSSVTRSTGGTKAGSIGKSRLRLITDSYSCAEDRSAPTWKWALWGEPRLVRVSKDGRDEITRNLCECIGVRSALSSWMSSVNRVRSTTPAKTRPVRPSDLSPTPSAANSQNQSSPPLPHLPRTEMEKPASPSHSSIFPIPLRWSRDFGD